ncbi:MAG TPA: hypothetical protein VHD38_00635 [Candidatus Paceibacterota bacterium]|nr:hypothetical protein [Candidatus Paceibacterota bacterium]
MSCIPHAGLADPQMMPHERDLCDDSKLLKLSYRGFMHCELHPYYQIVFPKWGCNCSTGECRPTDFKLVEPSAECPEGVMIMVDGVYCPVPRDALHKEKATIPAALLQWPAHVCCLSTPPDPKITCAWINVSG